MEVYSSKIPLRHDKHVAFDLVLWKCLTCILRPWENVGPLKRTNFLFSNVFYPSLLPVSLVFSFLLSSLSLDKNTIQGEHKWCYLYSWETSIVKKGKKVFQRENDTGKRASQKILPLLLLSSLLKTCFITEKNRKVSGNSETHTNSPQSIFLITFKALKNGWILN